ncbi:MAG TPA: neutral/alkaline non-lysosomal ceramidase N-terminal domain-containing protein [Bryobacteraceae bacterium]|nr:neutral/alkaline non-lysosomal ceramidase N-terminal domain-containing protein [Bryobacteraceae bacterium]
MLILALPAAAEFKAGMAKVDLDPPPGMAMGGYSGRSGGAEGMLDPNQARVLVMSDGARTIALVTLDLIFPFDMPEADSIRAAAKTAGVEEVILHASHSHSGPTYGANREAYRKAVDRTKLAIIGASKTMVPAKIGAGFGVAYIGHNRRYSLTDGQTKMFWRNETKVPSGPYDPTVGVIRIDRENGSPLAILVNFACHPVVFGPDNLLYSADYPGAMRNTIEQAAGEGVMAFFLQGAAGDINPNLDKTPLEHNALEAMKRVGGQLGAEAVRVAKTIASRAPEGELRWKTERLTVAARWDVEKMKAQIEKQFPTMDPARKARLLQPKMTLPVTTLIIGGEYAFVTMPGEPFVEFQMQLRARSPLPFTFLLGYTNGGYLYFPTIAAAARGGYGASSATYVEVGAGERMMYTGLRSIYELLGKLREKPAQE